MKGDTHMIVKTLTGNHAVAWAVKYARVKFVAAYPITPQTTIVEKIAEMIEYGEMDAEILRVESEHSALAATLGAAAAGVRSFTATSSQGLLYMHEMVWWASGSRIPVVMAVATRALGPPWNIHNEHSDIQDQRDTGWIIAMAENNQEVFDLVLQAFKISEDPRVFLPIMVGLDGFVLTHTVEPVAMPEQARVDEWLPPRRQPYVMDPEYKNIIGNVLSDLDYMKLRESIQKDIMRAKTVINEVDKEYGELFGRSYGGLIECYNCEKADYILVTMGAWSGDAKEAVDKVRGRGYNAGLVRIRFIRPWPREELYTILSRTKGVLVVDRSISFGLQGHLFTDIAATIRSSKTSLRGIVTGLGGFDIGVEDFEKMLLEFIQDVEKGGFVDDNLTIWYPEKVIK